MEAGSMNTDAVCLGTHPPGTGRVFLPAAGCRGHRCVERGKRQARAPQWRVALRAGLRPDDGAVFASYLRVAHRAHVFCTPKSSTRITVGDFSGLIASRANDRCRRVLLIPVRPDERRLTEPTTAVQPWRREPLFVPHTCRSQSPSRPAQLGGIETFAEF